MVGLSTFQRSIRYSNRHVGHCSVCHINIKNVFPFFGEGDQLRDEFSAKLMFPVVDKNDPFCQGKPVGTEQGKLQYSCIQSFNRDVCRKHLLVCSIEADLEKDNLVHVHQQVQALTIVRNACCSFNFDCCKFIVGIN